MAAAADHGFFRGVYEGCISGCDSGIERRPYHRNCGCALHNKSNNNSSNNNHGSSSSSNARSRCKNVSYPIRRSWSEGSLVLSSSSSLHLYNSSPSSSPLVVEMGRNINNNNNISSQLESCSEEDDNISLFSIKV